jgi:hypothetical protein
MPLRQLSDAEFDEVCRAIEAVRPSLSREESAALRSELAKLNERVCAFWRLWAKPGKQYEKELRTVARLCRELAQVLGDPPTGDWLEAEESPIVDLPHHLSFVYSGSGRTGTYPRTFEKALRDFDRLLDDVALAADRAADSRLTSLARGMGSPARGRDKVAKLLLIELRDIWLQLTKRRPDARIDGEMRYRGNFWQFVWASSAVCREFMSDKGTAGALFSRLDRLIRQPKRAVRSHPAIQIN